MNTPLPLNFDDRGLLPVVVQDHLTGQIRMVAWATAEAIATTLRTGRATFWSRSRGELWEKGQTSGNGLRVLQMLVDCDADCVVYLVDPQGPTCHTGAASCFFQALGSHDDEQGTTHAFLSQKSEQAQTLLERLETMLEARKESYADESYTKSLYEGGKEKIGGKIREEADELARAIAAESTTRVEDEAADVIYHLLVGLRYRGISWRNVLAILARRFGTSGHEEKALRPMKNTGTKTD